jgi:pyruvate-formate lyase-activating enzyme
MENILAIGDFLYRFGEGRILQIDLLPYNRGGIIRYEMLGRHYQLDKSLSRQNDEYLEEIRETLARKMQGSCPVSLGH